MDYSVLSRCNKSNAQKLVNDLLSAMYNEVYLATHSLGGKSSKESCKEGLPVEAVEKIIGITDLTKSSALRQIISVEIRRYVISDGLGH